MQDRHRRIVEIFLLRTAGPYIGSLPDIGVRWTNVRFTPKAHLGKQAKLKSISLVPTYLECLSLHLQLGITCGRHF